MGHRAREARQKRGPKRDGQGCNCRVVDPSFDGPRELVELGKERAERPAHGRVAAVRAAGPPCLYQQRAHERNGRRLKGAIAAKEALDDRLAGQGFRP